MWRALDLDALLSEEERIPCQFSVDAIGLGFLDPSNDRPHLQQGAKVELPLYMAKSLKSKGIVEMELPKHYDHKMRDNIAASALNINLKEYTPYYFEVGMELAQQLRDADLQNTVRIAFCGDRYRSLMINALSSSEDDSADLAKELTARETSLYMTGVKTAREIEDWRRQRSSLLRRSSVLGRRGRNAFDSMGGSAKRPSHGL